MGGNEIALRSQMPAAGNGTKLDAASAEAWPCGCHRRPAPSIAPFTRRSARLARGRRREDYWRPARALDRDPAPRRLSLASRRVQPALAPERVANASKFNNI